MRHLAPPPNPLIAARRPRPPPARLQLHSAFPLHCLVGGGDQLYNDGVWQVEALKAWGRSDDL